MKTCWLYRGAIRNHLDEGRELSPAARLHARGCEACARELRTHCELLAELREKPTEAEAPFLRARILNSLEEAPPRRLNWAPGLALVAVVAIIFVSTRRKEPNGAAPDLQFKSPKVAALHEPFEQELENLRADTTNALRALAANFLPDDLP